MIILKYTSDKRLFNKEVELRSNFSSLFVKMMNNSGKLIFLLFIGFATSHDVFHFQPEQIHLSFGGKFLCLFSFFYIYLRGLTGRGPTKLPLQTFTKLSNTIIKSMNQSRAKGRETQFQVLHEVVNLCLHQPPLFST